MAFGWWAQRRPVIFHSRATDFVGMRMPTLPVVEYAKPEQPEETASGNTHMGEEESHRNFVGKEKRSEHDEIAVVGFAPMASAKYAATSLSCSAGTVCKGEPLALRDASSGADTGFVSPCEDEKG